MRLPTPLRAMTGAVLTVGLVAAGSAAALAHDPYEVKPGDTLASIASGLDQFDTWRELHELNTDIIADPNLIFPGQLLALTGDVAPAPAPSKATSSSKSAPAKPKAEPTSKTAPEPSTSSATSTSTSVWDRVAACESNGNWSVNTGNGYYGGLQFAKSSWDWVGGSGMPHQASKAEQIKRAEILLDRQGWNAWPACSKKLGLR